MQICRGRCGVNEVLIVVSAHLTFPRIMFEKLWHQKLGSLHDFRFCQPFFHLSRGGQAAESFEHIIPMDLFRGRRPFTEVFHVQASRKSSVVSEKPKKARRDSFVGRSAKYEEVKRPASRRAARNLVACFTSIAATKCGFIQNDIGIVQVYMIYGGFLK